METSAGSQLQIKHVSKRFSSSRHEFVDALKNVNLDINAGEFLVLLGPSGCGKTTLLRCIAGFENIDSGTIFLNDLKLDNLKPNKRPVNTVFQSYALFPHMTVLENISFGLENEGLSKIEILERANELLILVGMEELSDRLPRQLSGGQQQRTALARALVKKPQVLLLDEPLAALDLKLRKSMQAELKRIHQATNTTFIFVTHDQNEAMALGDRIAVFNNGEIQQIGTPQEIYASPINEFVADFIGDSIILSGEISNQLFIGSGVSLQRSEFNGIHGEVKIMLRPENLQTNLGDRKFCEAKITNVNYFGDGQILEAVNEQGLLIKVKETTSILNQYEIGQVVPIFLNDCQIRVLLK